MNLVVNIAFLTEFSYYDIILYKGGDPFEFKRTNQTDTERDISAILNGRNNNVSMALATLIEEKYGYSSAWVLDGIEPKLKVAGKNRTLSDIHKKAILQIEKLSPEQIKAVLAFIKSLEEVENDLKGGQ